MSASAAETEQVTTTQYRASPQINLTTIHPMNKDITMFIVLLGFSGFGGVATFDENRS